MAKELYTRPSRVVKASGISTWWTISVPLVTLLISFLLALRLIMLPAPLMDVDCSYQPTRFCTRHAVGINSNLTEIGPRPAGSYANEVLTVEYLSRELDKLIAGALPVHSIEYEVQSAIEGSFHIADSVVLYQSLQNVVVRFTPQGASKESSVLINSHFDSKLNSPGAGDAGIMVSVMLETLRVLSQNVPDRPFYNSLIFLFNGAEEFKLRGSHAFITTHQWAKTVKMFINLDSTGGAGRELLFQVTPSSPWLLELYGKAIVHPNALITVQEIYTSGLVPSTTDYQIFRDHGHIPGIDMALTENGYIYHTENDLPNTIPLGTYQNVGDNVLSLAKEFSGHAFLMHTTDGSDDFVFQENEIYFDFLGWVFVHYSSTSALIINVLIPLATLTLIVVSLFAYAKRFNLCICRLISKFFQIFVVQVFSIVLAFGIVITLAFTYDAANGSMRWYSNIWLIAGIYYIPAVASLMVGPMLFLWWQQRIEKSNASALPVPVFVQMCLHAHCVTLILMVWTLTGLGIQTAFMFSLIVSFYGLALLINVLSKMILCDYRWIIFQLVCSLPAFAFFSDFIIRLLEGFVPIQGRSGPLINPELVISAFTCVVAVAQFGLIVPMVNLVRRPSVVLAVIVGIFVVALISMCTPIGFPYRPTVTEQRFSVYHTERTFHGPDQSVRRFDSGYLIHAQDRHMTRYLEEILPDVQAAGNLDNDCETELMCGIADIVGSSGRLGKWLPGGKPRIDKPVQLRLLNVSFVRDTVSRYQFEMEGPPSMNMFISPVDGFAMVDWTISPQIWRAQSLWGQRDQHVVRLLNTIKQEPFYFSLDIATPSNTTSTFAIDIAVASPCVVDKTQETEEFQRLQGRFPDWAQLTPCISSYTSWQI